MESLHDDNLAAFNLTIQHTVAATVDGLLPERVMDITITGGDIAVSRERLRGTLRSVDRAAAPLSVVLSYKIAIFDSLLTLAKLRESLTLAAREGTMNRDLRFYAAQFGAIGMTYSTLVEPHTVAIVSPPVDAPSRLSTVQIVCLVVGIIVGMMLFAVFLAFCKLHGSFHNPFRAASIATAPMQASNNNNKLYQHASAKEPQAKPSKDTNVFEPAGGRVRPGNLGLFRNSFSEPYGEAYCDTIDGAIGQTISEFYAAPHDEPLSI